MESESQARHRSNNEQSTGGRTSVTISGLGRSLLSRGSWLHSPDTAAKGLQNAVHTVSDNAIAMTASVILLSLIGLRVPPQGLAAGVSWHTTFGGLDARCAISPKKSPRGNVPLGDESLLAARLECRTRGVVQERRAPRRDRSKLAADDYGAGRRQGALVG